MSHVPGGLIVKRYLNGIRPASGVAPPESPTLWDTTNISGQPPTLIYGLGDRRGNFTNIAGTGVNSCVGLLSCARSTGKRYLELIWSSTTTFGAGVRLDCGITDFNPIGFGSSGCVGTNSVGLRSLSWVLVGNVNMGAIAAPSTLKTVMIAVDFNTGNFWVGLDGAWGGGAFPVGDPGTLTNPTGAIAAGTPMMPFGSFETGSLPTAVTICAAAADQTYPIPAGFVEWH